VSQLESLKAITALSFLSDNIEDGVYKFGTFGVMSLGPVVSGTRLTKNEVVWSEDLSERSRSNGVHGSGLKIDKDGSGHVFTAGSLIEVDIDSLQLQVRVTVVGTGGVDTVFVGDDFPEFGSDLVSALSGLDMNDFSHVDVWGGGD
jgi:hypothetical protein